MFAALSFSNWIGFTTYDTLDSAPFWIVVLVVTTLITTITIPLDERWAKRRDRTKRMKVRSFE
jgi:hypothetical protein